MPPPLNLPGVLLLCESEPLGALDKRAIREAGAAEVRVMTSGVAAARMLAGLAPAKPGFSPEIIVCTQKLADMDGEQFCAILRLHPRLLAMPILLVLPNDSEAEQLKTLGSGASALLGRPYSVPVLQEKLAALAAERPRLEQLRLAAQHADTSAFDAALATYGMLLRPERQPEDHLGLMLLMLAWSLRADVDERAARRLVEELMLPWAPRFLELLAEHADDAFYGPLACLARATLGDWQARYGLVPPSLRLYR